MAVLSVAFKYLNIRRSAICYNLIY